MDQVFLFPSQKCLKCNKTGSYEGYKTYFGGFKQYAYSCLEHINEVSNYGYIFLKKEDDYYPNIIKNDINENIINKDIKLNFADKEKKLKNTVYNNICNTNTNNIAKNTISDIVQPTNVPNHQQNDDEQNLCSVCMEKQKSCILIPCKHLCVCSECASLLEKSDEKKCPLCRTKFETIITGIFI